jgi:hypothetical protein
LTKKSWLLIALTLLVLAATGFTARWWVPALFHFNQAKKDDIQTLSAEVGAVAAVVAILVTIDLGIAQYHSNDRETALMVRGIPDATHQLRPGRTDFTGRKNELKTALRDIQNGVTVSIVCGMGGVGKTSLALRIAHEVAYRYPDGQLCVSLKGTSDTPTRPEEVYAQVARTYLGLEVKLPEDEAGLLGLYNSALSGKRVILFLDNAKEANQIGRFAPPPPGCLLIVTSRQYFDLAGVQPRNLEAMTPDDASDLLLKIAPKIGAEAGRIAELCGRLPLALRAAATYLTNFRDQSPARYAERLRGERTRLEVIGTEGVDIGVEASFGLSYGALVPDEATVFRKLAVFPGSFDGPAAEGVSEDADNVSLGKLVNLSLVMYDGSRYRLHDLVRLFATKKLDDPAGDAQERWRAALRYARHYAHVLFTANEIFQQGDGSTIRGSSCSTGRGETSRQARRGPGQIPKTAQRRQRFAATLRARGRSSACVCIRRTTWRGSDWRWRRRERWRTAPQKAVT